VRQKEDILLALSHPRRVRRIGILAPNTNLGKLIKVMDDQFPILECIYFWSRTNVAFPATFQAPNLHHLSLSTSYPPIESPLFTTAAGLVILELYSIPRSAYCHFLSRLPLLLQLERLLITFEDPPLVSDAETQLLRPPDMFQVTLTKLRRLQFKGTLACLEELVSRINVPALRNFEVYLFYVRPFQVTFPRLVQFVQSSKRLRFNAVELSFADDSFTVSLLEADPWWRTLNCGLNPHRTLISGHSLMLTPLTQNTVFMGYNS
jgi:hypothetical protein